MNADDLAKILSKPGYSVVARGVSHIASKPAVEDRVIVCKTCEKKFSGWKTRKYCSPRCAYASKERSYRPLKDRGTAVCRNCDTVFNIHTSAPKAKFCCHPCVLEFYKDQYSATLRNLKRPESKTRISSVCPACKKEFKSWKSANRVFCSMACSIPRVIEQGTKTRHEMGLYAAAKSYTRGIKGWVELGGQRFFARSSWEANYGRYLEWLKIHGQIKSWRHEPTTFWFSGIKRGCMSYLPDFEVIADGVEYHEVKGWMDDKSRTKIRRMAKYHPQVVLKVIDSKSYRALQKQVSGIVPGWTK